MSAEMAGALVGAALGLASYSVIQRIAERIEAGRTGPDAARTAGLLRSLAAVDLMVFPIIGYFVGPLVLEGR